MPKLNKIQKYAIHWLNYNGMDIDSIAKELNLTSKQVAPLIERSSPTIPSENKDESTTKISTSKDLMITHTSGKKINSVAIMTKEASERGDSARNNLPQQKNLDTKKGIFRPKQWHSIPQGIQMARASVLLNILQN